MAHIHILPYIYLPFATLIYIYPHIHVTDGPYTYTLCYPLFWYTKITILLYLSSPFLSLPSLYLPGDALGAVEGFKALYRVDRSWPALPDWLVRAFSLQKRQVHCCALLRYPNISCHDSLPINRLLAVVRAFSLQKRQVHCCALLRYSNKPVPLNLTAGFFFSFPIDYIATVQGLQGQHGRRL